MERPSFLNKLIGGAVALLVMGAVMATSAQDAEAAFVMTLTDGAGNTVSISDGGPNDSNGLTGVIAFSGTLTGGSSPSIWLVNVTTGITAPVIGSPSLARMDLNSVNATSNNGGGTLTIALSVTGVTTPAGNVHALMDIGGTTDGTVQYQAYVDGSNAQYGMGTPIGSTGALGPGAFSGTYGGNIVGLGSPYSMTQVVTVSHASGFAVSSFNAGVKVPEPTSLALFGVGLLGIGFLWRRRSTRSRAHA